jgi:hypothetical protein
MTVDCIILLQLDTFYIGFHVVRARLFSLWYALVRSELIRSV